MTVKTQATIEDLYYVDAKAEIIDGEIVYMSPTGFWPSRASGAIYASLREHERNTKSGFALPDNAAFHVVLPNRQSLSPDAAWHTGLPSGMKFLEGAPVFAVEVRSEGDYGPQADKEIANKRRDYFAAGTLCVWDVDLLSTDVVKAYHSIDPQHPVVFHRGEFADAGNAVPGWSIAVNDIVPDAE